MIKLLILFLFLVCDAHTYVMMFDMTSNKMPVVTKKYSYTYVEFQPAIANYKASFNSDQKTRLLYAIKKYKALKNKQFVDDQKITSMYFQKIENVQNKIRFNLLHISVLKTN